MIRPLLAAFASLPILAGVAHAQQTRSYCSGAVEATGGWRHNGSNAFLYVIEVFETAHAPGRLPVQVQFSPPPPARSAVVPPFILEAGARRVVVVGTEPRVTAARPSLERERILNFATIACPGR